MDEHHARRQCLPVADRDMLKPQLPVGLPLLEVRHETPRMVTLFFPLPEGPERSFEPVALIPGQFVMIWLPGVDEKPYAISHLDSERFAVTVMRRGRFSTSLHQVGPGAVAGFRGPYGRGFWGWERFSDPRRVVIVAGGCGMAPLALLAERIPGCTIVQGSPTAEEVLFRGRFPQQVVCTEDGTLGRRGLPSAWLGEAIHRGAVDMVYTCGPEPMMYVIMTMCRLAGVECQASLERYMKCGFGICGQCECDGRLVCQDGPVFSAAELAKMPSFGHMARLKTGQKVGIEVARLCSGPSLSRAKQETPAKGATSDSAEGK